VLVPPFGTKFTPTVWRPPRGRTHGDAKIRACKIRTEPGRGVCLRSHQIRRVSLCSSKNSSANNIKHFLLQISPIVQSLYLAGRSEEKKSDLLKGTLRSKFTSVNATEAHTLLCFVVTISYHTFIFYFFPWRWDRFESQLSVRTKSTFGHDAHG
jgi:hypothetical protein